MRIILQQTNLIDTTLMIKVIIISNRANENQIPPDRIQQGHSITSVIYAKT